MDTRALKQRKKKQHKDASKQDPFGKSLFGFPDKAPLWTM